MAEERKKNVETVSAFNQELARLDQNEALDLLASVRYQIPSRAVLDEPRIVRRSAARSGGGR